MRYIDNSSLDDSVPQEWVAQSEAALDELRQAANRDERAAVLAQKASVWRELKDALASLSGDKCWYCETPKLRSDGAVDHFRPKGRVFEAPSHEGYWWMAFDYGNFRFACTYCNSRRLGADTEGGKADHFPLLKEGMRALSEESAVKDEYPVLLDPTAPADPGLLWFEPDGRVVPKYAEADGGWRHFRADQSISLYHLNEGGTKTRRRDKHKTLLKAIEAAARHLGRFTCGELESMEDLNEAFDRIREMVKPSADYSSAAKATVLAYRHEHPWLDEILGTM